MDNELTREYMFKMRGLLTKRALYSDETEMFQSPNEPEPGDTVTIRFRTRKNNVDAVYFISGDIRREMKVTETSDGFDYYSTQVTAGEKTILYFLK